MTTLPSLEQCSDCSWGSRDGKTHQGLKMISSCGPCHTSRRANFQEQIPIHYRNSNMLITILFIISITNVVASPMSNCFCPQVDCTAKATSTVCSQSHCEISRASVHADIDSQNCSCLNFCCASEIGSKVCDE